MKKILKKTLAILLLCMIVIDVTPATAVHAKAPSVQKDVKAWLYKGKVEKGYLFIQDSTLNGKITKLKNSKPSIAEVSAGTGGYLQVTPKAPGVTKVTFQYDKRKLTSKITVVKWSSPCKEFKIGNKNYAKYFEKSGQYNLNKQKKDTAQKLKIAPKKGWKLIKIEQLTSDGGEKKIKNNSKVNLSIKMSGTGIFAYFKNAKTGEIRKLYFGYSSNPFASGNVCDCLVQE